MINCEFSIADWQEDTLKVMGDCTLKKATVKYTYSGDIEGESDAEFLLLYLPNGNASFTAVERIRGQYKGSEFTCVLNHGGMHENNVANGCCEVTHATGSLSGFCGKGHYKADAATVKLQLI